MEKNEDTLDKAKRFADEDDALVFALISIAEQSKRMADIAEKLDRIAFGPYGDVSGEQSS